NGLVGYSTKIGKCFLIHPYWLRNKDDGCQLPEAAVKDVYFPPVRTRINPTSEWTCHENRSVTPGNEGSTLWVLKYLAMKRVDMVYRSIFGRMAHHLLDGIIQHSSIKTESNCAIFGSEF